jgi:hypothetical protein
MDAQQEPHHSRTKGQLAKFLPWLMVVIIIAVVAAVRFRLINVPLERDEGEYAYAGQLMLQGVPPYLLAYNMKMPGVYAAYALILAAFGQTCAAIHLGLLLVNAATTLLIFLLAKYLIDSWAGVCAAAAFAVMSMGAPVQGLSANAEHFVVLFAVAGLLLLLYALDRDNLVVLAAASVLLGIGVVMKQHGAAFVALAALYLLFVQLRRKPIQFRPLLIRVAIFAAGVMAPIALTCLILWRAGVFDKFWFWTFAYALEYASIVSLRQGLVILESRFIYIAIWAIPVWILFAAGVAALFKNRQVCSRRFFVVAFLVFSFLAICPGFYFRPHYFVLLLPAVALLSGLGLFGIRQALQHRVSAIANDLVAVCLIIAALLYTFYFQKGYLLQPDVAAVSRMTYPEDHFPAYLKIAQYLKDKSSPDDEIGVFGSEPQVFFYTDRRSATSYIYVYPLMEPQPYALQMQQEMIQQIEAAKPRFLLFTNAPHSWARRPNSNEKIIDWFWQYQKEYYQCVALADFAPVDGVHYYWNEDTAKYQASSLLGIAVFRRKE